MTPEEKDLRQHHFADRLGVMWESFGGARSCGRILGWLLICEPPLQSMTAIAKDLHMSKGSVSTSTRVLLELGMVERVHVRGSRAAWYQVTPEAWVKSLLHASASNALMRELAEEGLRVLQDDSAERRARLEGMREVYAFFEVEFPRLIERWKTFRAGYTGTGDSP